MAETEAHGLVERLFRHESGRLTASLVRLLGVGRIALAEEIVQDTLLAALQSWPYHGLPDSPAAWLQRVARNKALDLLRSARHRRRVDDPKLESSILESSEADPATGLTEERIAEDELRLMFACCHPSLPPESQIALTLRLLCGLTAAEIASAFLAEEEAIRKRLYRARATLREEAVRFAIPEKHELPPRLDALLASLYLLFNEGYEASHAEEPIRRDLCLEALRLALLVSRDARLHRPEVDAVIALMCFQAARFPARTDETGALLLLAEQDRGLWDAELIARGFRHLDASARGEALSRYHLEAGIAACHAGAASFEETDWERILFLYDALLERFSSPVVRLNRAIALGEARGPEAALESLDALADEPALSRYALYPAARGEFLRRRGRTEEAAARFREAIALAGSEAERRLLRGKLAACRAR